MNTVAGSTLPTLLKALKDSALWFVRRGKSPIKFFISYYFTEINSQLMDLLGQVQCGLY